MSYSRDDLALLAKSKPLHEALALYSLDKTAVTSDAADKFSPPGERESRDPLGRGLTGVRGLAGGRGANAAAAAPAPGVALPAPRVGARGGAPGTGASGARRTSFPSAEAVVTR